MVGKVFDDRPLRVARFVAVIAAIFAERATIDDVVEQLARGLEDGRRVIRGIRPAALDDLGLAAAIDDLCQQERPRRAGDRSLHRPRRGRDPSDQTR